MSKLIAGGPRHQHRSPELGAGNQDMSPSRHRWNSVARSDCGHLWVRRYTWVGMVLLGWAGGDHFPVWVRLRPWHVGALLRWVTGR